MSETGIKICGGCKVSKPFEDFYKSKKGRMGFHNHCKLCCKKFKEQHIKIAKLENRYHKYTDEYRKKAAADKRQRYKENTELMRQQQIDYRKNRDQDEFKKQNREYVAYRRKTDLNYRLMMTLRGRVRSALIANQSRKITTTTELIGCTVSELKIHLESKFKDGMTWENYGYRGWHVDHIKPCDSFDLTDPTQQKNCFHYTNLQPLWAFDNFSKGAKYND